MTAPAHPQAPYRAAGAPCPPAARARRRAGSRALAVTPPAARRRGMHHPAVRVAPYGGGASRLPKES